MDSKNINSIHEWSWVLSVSVPEAYFYYLVGSNVTVEAHPHSEILFYFLKSENIKIKKTDDIPTCLSIPHEKLYANELPSEFNCGWKPPPYQKHFLKISKLKPKKPVIVINNKYNEEWSVEPYNFLSENFLTELFKSKISDKFDFYYIRYNSDFESEGYYDDVCSKNDFGDYSLIKQFKNVTGVYDVMSKYKIGFNEAQMWMHSHASHSIAAAGAGAILSCYFGNDVFIYNHPNCPSSNRKIWDSDSWLKNLGSANIWGYKDYDELLKAILDKVI